MDKKIDSSSERITMVLVDTSAFTEANSDFIGLHSALLPSFFNATTEKGIVLLTHPILDKEIQKTYRRFQHLQRVSKAGYTA